MRTNMLGLGHSTQQYSLMPLPPLPLTPLPGSHFPGLYDAGQHSSLLLSHRRDIAADLAARQRALVPEEFRLAQIAHLESHLAQLVAESRQLAVTEAARMEVVRAHQLQITPPDSTVSRTLDGYSASFPRYASLQRSAIQDPPAVTPRPTSGLDLLTEVSIASGALPTPEKSTTTQKEFSTMINRSDTASVVSTAESVNDPSSGDTKVFIDSVAEWDVLCGRGGRSNHHPGNKRYRQVVAEMKLMYRNTETKSVKTDLSRAIVEHVCDYGGRFVKNDSKTGRFYVLSHAEARKKTSQALRETKALKWTL